MWKKNICQIKPKGTTQNLLLTDVVQKSIGMTLNLDGTCVQIFDYAMHTITDSKRQSKCTEIRKLENVDVEKKTGIKWVITRIVALTFRKMQI